MNTSYFQNYDSELSRQLTKHVRFFINGNKIITFNLLATSFLLHIVINATMTNILNRLISADTKLRF